MLPIPAILKLNSCVPPFRSPQSNSSRSNDSKIKRIERTTREVGVHAIIWVVETRKNDFLIGYFISNF